MAQARRSNQGVSLIEVLLAVSILAFGILGVLRAYATAVSALEATQNVVEGITLLKQKMADIEEAAIEAKGEFAEQIGHDAFESPYEDFTWNSELKETDLKGLRTLSLAVSSELYARTYSLETYVLDKIEEDEQLP